MPPTNIGWLALGPPKAKLIARASATDMSPWKINKSAPRTLTDSVSVALRPLLSYTLWRLYEDLNILGVGNSCILLTNDVITYNTAQTLNVCVGTISDMRQLIASRTNLEDLDSFGDVEREFGRREPVPKSNLSWREERAQARKAKNDTLQKDSTGDPKNCASDQKASTSDQKTIIADQNDNTEDPKNCINDLKGSTGDQNGNIDKPESHFINHPITYEGLAIKDTETRVPEIKSNIPKMEELSIVSEDRKRVQEWLTKPDSAVNLTKIEDTGLTGFNSVGHEKPVDTLCYVEIASTPLEKEKSEKPADRLSYVQVASTPTKKDTIEKSASRGAVNSQPANTQSNEWEGKKGVIDTPTMASDLLTNETPAALTLDNGVFGNAKFSPEREGVSPREAETQNHRCSSQSAASSGSMPCSPRLSSETNSLSTTEAQEQEDSDEEVVVFNPRAKRWSSQSKPIKDISQTISPAKTLNSRNLASGFESPPRKGSSDQVPVTPSPSIHAQASLLLPNQSPRDQTFGEQSPRGQVHRDQALSEQGLRRHSPRNISPRNRSPRNNQAQRKQNRPNQGPQNRAPPAIIDPDFFGRSAVVNIKPQGQNGQGRYFHRGGHRRGPRGHEADVEYVLTSGATREATRGKGKLWVP